MKGSVEKVWNCLLTLLFVGMNPLANDVLESRSLSEIKTQTSPL